MHRSPLTMGHCTMVMAKQPKPKEAQHRDIMDLQRPGTAAGHSHILRAHNQMHCSGIIREQKGSHHWQSPTSACGKSQQPQLGKMLGACC